MQATGGSAVAADPTTPLNAYWPQARNATGVDALTEWFANRNSDGVRTFLFLVGGPGGGKSHVSANLVADLEEVAAKETSLAQRSHLYVSATQEILLINDATIEELDEMHTSLGMEIDQCVEMQRSLIACVNRGILIEELGNPTGSNLARRVLSWLTGEGPRIGEENELTPCQESEYLKSAQLKTTNGMVIEIAVAYVDTCSLFEENPLASFDGSMKFESAFKLPRYKLTKWTKRSSVELASMPGAHLIHSAIAKIKSELIDGDSGLEMDPISANLETLQNEEVVRNISDLLRAAEIASGQRFTFREVWGIISRLVSGDLSKNLRGEQVSQYLLSIQPSSTDTPKKAFEKAQQLSSVRLSQGIFGIQGASERANKNSSHPITALLAQSDPTRDGEPGTYIRGEVDSGWMTPILDSFAGSIAGESPLRLLISNLEKTEKDSFKDNVTNFDWALDFWFQSYVTQPKIKDEDRSIAIRWYSTYLSRLYAVVNGIPAFVPQIAAWIEVWLSSPSVPNHVEKQLLTLLRPTRAELKESDSYIPIFDSRTIPVTEMAAEPLVVAKLAGVKTSTQVDGDSIILSIEEQGAKVAEILFDFSLLRDALACTNEYVGATEVSGLTAPRLERLRASRLAPQRLKHGLQLSVIEGYSASEVVSP